MTQKYKKRPEEEFLRKVVMRDRAVKKKEWLPAGFGEREKQLRNLHRLSQQDVADILHTSVSTISRLENGLSSTIDIELISGLADLYDVSTDFLLGKQFSKDLSYREYITGTIAEDKDILAEECDEEYGDAYDNDFENKKAVNLENVLPSLQRKYSQMIKADTENQQSEDDFMHMDPFVFFYTPADAPEAEKAEIKTEHKKNKHKSVYIGEKKTNDSWEYPVYHKALNNLQMEAMLEALYDKDFDEAQREYLIYRYGLENQDPQKLKETAEHFNLTLANAKKIEKAGLDALRKKLQEKKLI